MNNQACDGFHAADIPEPLAFWGAWVILMCRHGFVGLFAGWVPAFLLATVIMLVAERWPRIAIGMTLATLAILAL